jgi:multidrug resistance protein MdtO
MAKRAGDLRGKLAEGLELLRPFPGRAEFAARLALICALTTLVVQIYQTPEPALTAYVAFFVMKPDRTTSIVICLVMTILITVIIGMVILVSMAVVDQPLWRVASMTTISFCLLFLVSASKLKPVGGIIALIIAYALDLLSKAQVGELATRGFLYAWLFVVIPAAVSFLVNLFLGPPPRRLAERALAHRLTLAAAMLRNADHHTRHLFTEALREDTAEIKTWLKLAGAEKTSPPEDIAALRQAAETITPILLLVDTLTRNAEPGLPSVLGERLAATLEQIADILNEGGYPTEITLYDEGIELLPSEAALVPEIKEALARFTQSPLPDLPPAEPAKAKPGFFLPDAFTNPQHVHYALKTTAAAMICYIVYSLLDWPGIHTSLITCYIVSQGTAAETVEKLTLRILGCLIGAAAGIAAIVFLIPDITSIGGLMAVVFVAAFASAWVAGGSPRISYAGFQIAFAFFLCAMQGAAPAFDMTIARDRVIGILFGNLVVFLIFTNVWPVTVTGRIDAAMASLLRKLGDMAKAAARSRRNSLASEACAAFGAIEQDLALAGYEPPTVRPPDGWLLARSRAAAEIAELMGPLFARSNQDTSFTREIARRLEAVAGRFGERSAGPAIEVNAAADDPGLLCNADPDTMDARIVASLEKLEHALEPHPVDPQALRYASA